MKMRSILLALVAATALHGPLAAGEILPDAVRFTVVIERGDLPLARDWLNAGLPPDFEGSRIGTGLMIAAWEGNVPMMELFHSRGADVNRTNSLGETALLHAAWKGHFSAVRWLIDRGARLNRDGKQWAALHYASFAGHFDIVRYLLSRGADVNALSVNGSTSLMMAAREGKEDIASHLLASGAKRDVVNDWGDTAVSWAMRHNNVSIAREIATSRQFEAAIAAKAKAPTPAIRSQPVSDRVETLLAQARKLDEAGLREDAMKLYRATFANLRRADQKRITAIGGRTLTRVVISARRDQPEDQTTRFNYGTPASEPDAQRSELTPSKQLANTPQAPPDLVDDWMRRARELEAAGRRSEALSAYREASALLRGGR